MCRTIKGKKTRLKEVVFNEAGKLDFKMKGEGECIPDNEGVVRFVDVRGERLKEAVETLEHNVT